MNEKFSDERISAYLDDELAADERATLERELAENAELRQAVEELRALRTGLQSLPRYRLETNLAERVLELAERAVLTGRPAEDDASGISRSTAAHRDGEAACEDRRPQPSAASMRSPAAPSRSAGGFSWRNLVWAATAAGVAAVLTNYYHVNNPADRTSDRREVRVASGEQSARNAPSQPDQSAQPSSRFGETAAVDSVVAPATESTADFQDATVARNRRTEAADGTVGNAAAGRALAQDEPDGAHLERSERKQLHGPASNAVADADAGKGGTGTADGDRAEAGVTDGVISGRSAGRGTGGQTSAAEGDLAVQSGAAASAIGGRADRGASREQTALAAAEQAAPISVFVLNVSHEAMRQRAFDSVLTANRVAIDEPREVGKLPSPRPPAPSPDAAVAESNAALREAPQVEMVELELTHEQLIAVLAAVDRQASDFALVGEFPLAFNSDSTSERIDQAADVAREATGGVKAQPPADAVAADEAADAASDADGSPPGDETPRDTAGAGGQSRSSANKVERAFNDKAGDAGRIERPRALAPRDVGPREKPSREAPPREARPSDSPAPRSRVQANGNTPDDQAGDRPKRGSPDDEARKDAAKKEAAEKETTAKAETKKGEAKPAPAGAVAEPRRAAASEPAVNAANEHAKDDRPALQEGASQRTEQAPADMTAAAESDRRGEVGGYARRVAPRSVIAPRAGEGPSRRRTASDVAPPAAPRPAPDIALAPAKARAAADDVATAEDAHAPADSPRIRVYFLLQPSHGPSPATVAGPSEEASGAAGSASAAGAKPAAEASGDKPAPAAAPE